MRFRLLVPFFLAALLFPARLAGQLTPLSEVFPVSVPEDKPEARAIPMQGVPAAAALPHGFAVASLRQDSSNADIVDGRLVDLSGQPGPLFLGDYFGDGAEPVLEMPAIAATGPGDFVLAWVEGGSDNLLYRRFGPGGVPRGEPVYLAEGERHLWGLCSPSVAGNSAGGFVIAWEQCNQPGSAAGLAVRAFNPAGQAATGELPISLPGSPGNVGIAGMPRAGIDAAGRFVVLWRQAGATTADPARLCGRAYGARGGFLGSPFCIGDLAGTTGGALAIDPTGAFLAVWFGPAASGGQAPLFVRRYQLDGTPLGDRVQIAAAADPSKLAASPDGKGNAALSWREGDRLRILLVKRNGVVQGTTVTISGVSNGWEGWITGESTINGVALSPSGRLLATWPSGRLILGQLWRASGLLP